MLLSMPRSLYVLLSVKTIFSKEIELLVIFFSNRTTSLISLMVQIHDCTPLSGSPTPKQDTETFQFSRTAKESIPAIWLPSITPSIEGGVLSKSIPSEETVFDRPAPLVTQTVTKTLSPSFATHSGQTKDLFLPVDVIALIWQP